jgi:competence protein ComGC
MNPPPPIGNPPTQHAERSGLALASMLLGICGIVLCLGPLAGIPAVICGHMAHSRINRSAGAITGSGMALTGLVTGYLSIAWIVVMAMLAAIAIPNFVKARNQAQYNMCQSNLKAIQGAKEVWKLENKKDDAAIPTDADLFGPAKPVQNKPVCPAGGSYSLNAVQESPACSQHGEIGIGRR